jgi:hypothetical protein
MANPNRFNSWRQNDLSWLTELPLLLARCSDLGIGADAAAMSLDELRGLYLFLSRAEKKGEEDRTVGKD